MRHVQLICKFSAGLLLTLSILNGSAHPAQASFQSLWAQIVNSPPPAPVRRGGSRGGYFCPVAPERGSAVWSDRPTLVWKGSVARVELVTNDLGTILWSKDIAVDQIASAAIESEYQTYRVTADAALQSGQAYRWRIYQSLVEEPFTVPFQMLSVEEKQRIAVDLSTGTALQRANIFAKLQLWSDFWYEMLTIDRPTTEVTQMVEAAFTHLCPDP
jgi:Domain of Unknown Function (DUF928)